MQNDCIRLLKRWPYEGVTPSISHDIVEYRDTYNRGCSYCATHELGWHLFYLNYLFVYLTLLLTCKPFKGSARVFFFLSLGIWIEFGV